MEFFLGLFTTFSPMPAFGGSLDFLGKFAQAIIEGVGMIGLGIIVFTLVLKGITLPFDIYQRYKMRKQNLIMKNMKEDLDKLQKQYANDKTTYNAKMQELYKKNGYSMFGACLPMLISLVILIVAFQGFNAYSRYANVKLFVDMAESYNATVLENAADGTDYFVTAEEKDGAFLYTFTDGEEVKIDITAEIAGKSISFPGEITVQDGYTYIVENINGDEVYYLCVKKEGKFLNYQYPLGTFGKVKTADGTEVAGFIPTTAAVREYRIDVMKMYAYLGQQPATEEDEEGNEVPTPEGIAYSALKTMVESGEVRDDAAVEAVCTDYLVEIGSRAAAKVYFKNKPSFLWIQNVWQSDATYRHPLSSTTVSGLGQDQYERLTAKLASEKKAYNGYYVLIILSIGTMLLSQFITMRSQKETNQYQSVDGQGAKTQKMMLFIMPLIYGVFAFTQSAAFSIYMIISSVITLLVTVLCNLILGHIFRKKEEQAIREQYGRTVPWKQKGKKRK